MHSRALVMVGGALLACAALLVACEGPSSSTGPSIAQTGGAGSPSSEPDGDADGSSTGWLETTWPLVGGETFTLRLHIHDTSDGVFDSLILFDDFRWLVGEVQGSTKKL